MATPASSAEPMLTTKSKTAAVKSREKPTLLYRWTEDPKEEAAKIESANDRLSIAMANPEYLLDHWIDIPTAPKANQSKSKRLTLREAILLALRYNPNIQNAELDRIIQRYQLRIAQNAFELQYALAGSVATQRTHYEGVGGARVNTYIGTPEVNLKTQYGTQVHLNLDNAVPNYLMYTPVLNLQITQPLLRGFGKDVNAAALLNAQDNDFLNKLQLNQSVSDQITQVIMEYRALILSGNNLENQKAQLKEAKKTYAINEKKIESGHLEPTANIQQSYQIESLSLMVEQAENEFKTTAQNLLRSIGLDPQMQLLVPSDINMPTMTIPDKKASINRALCHNVEYLAQKMVVRSAERAYKVAKNEQLWQLDFTGGIESGRLAEVANYADRKGVNRIFNGQNITESATINLRIPIQDKGQRNQLIQAKVQLEKARLSLIASKRTLETNITTLIMNMESLVKRYELAQKQVKLAMQSYELEKKKMAAGISSALDLSNTQNQLIQSQIGLMTAKIAYLNQLAALQRLLGTTLDAWQINLRYA